MLTAGVQIESLRVFYAPRPGGRSSPTDFLNYLAWVWRGAFECIAGSKNASNDYGAYIRTSSRTLRIPDV